MKEKETRTGAQQWRQPEPGLSLVLNRQSVPPNFCRTICMRLSSSKPISPPRTSHISRGMSWMIMDAFEPVPEPHLCSRLVRDQPGSKETPGAGEIWHPDQQSSVPAPAQATGTRKQGRTTCYSRHGTCPNSIETETNHNPQGSVRHASNSN